MVTKKILLNSADVKTSSMKTNNVILGFAMIEVKTFEMTSIISI